MNVDSAGPPAIAQPVLPALKLCSMPIAAQSTHNQIPLAILNFPKPENLAISLSCQHSRAGVGITDKPLVSEYALNIDFLRFAKYVSNGLKADLRFDPLTSDMGQFSPSKGSVDHDRVAFSFRRK